MQQSAFDFPLSNDYAVDDFAVSPANQLAYSWVTAWPAWESYGLVVYGGPDCGKTHLAHIWKERSQARLIHASSLQDTLLPELFSSPPCFIIEDIERIAEETALFHLLNHVKAQQGSVLLTALAPPNQLHFSLADMRSRVNALPAARISPPDDALLKAVLCKQFADHQLRVPEEVVDFLLARMERSFAMAKCFVNQLDMQAMKEQCSITIPFIRRVLFSL